MTRENSPESTQGDETASGDITGPETEESPAEGNAGGNNDESRDGAVFDREYVEKLRKESAGYRDRAKTAESRLDELSKLLWAERVKATGKVENPAEIPYNPDIIDNIDAINEAIDGAINERPYIRSRRPSGDIGQGNKGDKPPVGWEALRVV
ncbi:hypothetical protein [Mycolicibacterium holsaticum]|uniref:Uncharacterized protein n=1 Tax=Mycolicibacterium holsaticum TaxID=152142 RepID=A0A1E3S4K5_9MYCO|nr:hypothetical protein [Mycolicibacterium holsaticum]ODQ96602.1 hypothetical protein BHQ17_00050 [Mycolicibacterium holsaticum]